MQINRERTERKTQKQNSGRISGRCIIQETAQTVKTPPPNAPAERTKPPAAFPSIPPKQVPKHAQRDHTPSNLWGQSLYSLQAEADAPSVETSNVFMG